MSTRILLADDHPIVRAGMRNILKGHADLELVGEVDHGRDLEATVQELQPDVLLLDLNMPDLDPASATRRLKAQYPDLQVLAVTAHDDAEFVIGLVAAGVAGYALKDEATESLVAAIRTVAQGGAWFTGRVTRQLAHKLKEPATDEQTADPAELGALTPREVEVLTLIGTGATNREIAEALFISKRTAETHAHHIYGKLGLKGRLEAMLYALEHGLVDT